MPLKIRGQTPISVESYGTNCTACIGVHRRAASDVQSVPVLGESRPAPELTGHDKGNLSPARLGRIVEIAAYLGNGIHVFGIEVVEERGEASNVASREALEAGGISGAASANVVVPEVGTIVGNEPEFAIPDCEVVCVLQVVYPGGAVIGRPAIVVGKVNLA